MLLSKKVLWIYKLAKSEVHTFSLNQSLSYVYINCYTCSYIYTYIAGKIINWENFDESMVLCDM